MRLQRIIHDWVPFTFRSKNGQGKNFMAGLWVSSGFPRGGSKVSACNAGDPGSIPGSERSPGDGNGNPLQYFAWKIPWTEELGGLQSMGLQRVGHDWATSLSFTFGSHLERGWAWLHVWTNLTMWLCLCVCVFACKCVSVHMYTSGVGQEFIQNLRRYHSNSLPEKGT